MAEVVFYPDLKRVEVEPGTTLLDAASQAGVLIDASCNGAGTCGACKVQVAGAERVPLTENEIMHLTGMEREQGMRLACQLNVVDNLEVHLPATHGGSGRKKKMVNLPEGFQPGERVSAVAAKVPKARLDYQVNDVDRVREAQGMPEMKVAPGAVKTLHQALETQGGKAALVFGGDTLLGAHAGKDTGIYGVAFDIGTTTVVGMLWNLETGELVDVESRTNYQSLYGADVISRISYSMASKAKLETMRSKVLQCCNEILDEMCDRSKIDRQRIYDAAFDGNTTMTHLALGVTARSMSRTPFAPVFCEGQNLPASMFGLNINPCANVYFLPIIAGHVGGDIVGMMIAADIDHISGSHVALDIGTNGEVVAVKDGKMVCCSTAAGPAFEGATISQGMRAAPGAIERVSIDAEGVHVGTIDDAPAVGICGSGLIDAVAALLDSGVVTPNGKMLSRREATNNGIPDAVAQCILSDGEELRFRLAAREDADDIALTQSDVREVQLAKGAILAGIQTLMKELDMSVEEVDSIMLAGAFGNYITKESALRIGLLPQVPVEKVAPIGNAAGVGCCMALLSAEERDHAEQAARATRHVELSHNMDFEEFYAMAMLFRV